MSSRILKEDDVIRALHEQRGLFRSDKDAQRFAVAIEAIPSADRQRGEWIKKPHKVYLPGDYEPDIIDYRDHQYNEEDHSIIQYWWHCNQCDYETSRWAKPTANYCPHCGAEMKGKSDE